MSEPFDPLDLRNLGESIARAMATAEHARLDQLPRFSGAGIYALYYCGPFPAYSRLVAANVDADEPHPIYVGQAVGPGARKGLTSPTAGTYLRSRLSQHAASIASTANLDIADFHARWLVLADVWVSLGEAVLIKNHSPVWNSLVEGFGNHDPGKGRRAGARPRWDILHPGRPWAEVLAPGEISAEMLTVEVEEYLRQRF